MAQPPKGKADYLALGEWNVVCFECGQKFKSSVMRKHWQGYWVCPEHWEARHSQDFVKGVPDVVIPPWVQPEPADTFTTLMCTPNGMTAIPNQAIPGCVMPGYISTGYLTP